MAEFETKEVRDMIKAQAPNLANFGDECGMRLQIPGHLQRDFRSLMSLSYELKKKNPDLKRNVKFDENDLGLFMDIQVKRNGRWNRVKPEQARKAVEDTIGNGASTGPDTLGEDELSSLLRGEGQD